MGWGEVGARKGTQSCSAGDEYKSVTLRKVNEVGWMGLGD